MRMSWLLPVFKSWDNYKEEGCCITEWHCRGLDFDNPQLHHSTGGTKVTFCLKEYLGLQFSHQKNEANVSSKEISCLSTEQTNLAAFVSMERGVPKLKDKQS